MLIVEAPGGMPGAAAVMARAEGENFPVASRVLPREVREDLLAIYGFARLVDELGDSVGGDRLAALDWLEAELARAFAGTAEHPLLLRLQSTVSRRGLTREPFARLIEANRVDQHVTRYQSWEQLRGYCALSADPVGELVLAVFGAATQERVALSDSICTALQLIEHCQDVAEDYAAGRIYMPRADLARFGCEESEFAREQVGGPLRDVLAFELERAHELLDAGAPLISELHGRARIAVAGFLAGGRAAADAIERSNYQVMAGPPPVPASRKLLALLGALRPRVGASARGPGRGPGSGGGGAPA